MKCEICGREVKEKISGWGYNYLCSKHMHQLHQYGKILDNNPRTQNDPNHFEIYGDIAAVDLYDQNGNKIDYFIIDKEDLDKIRYKKWVKSSYSHIIKNQDAKKHKRGIAYTILGLHLNKNNHIVIDHINGDPFDNRKCNLRVRTQSENTINKSYMSNNTSGFIGVSFKKDRNTWDPEIRKGFIRCHLGATKIFEEAVYARYIAEELVFKDFVNLEEHKKKEIFTKDLPSEIKEKIYDKVLNKLKNKNLVH